MLKSARDVKFAENEPRKSGRGVAIDHMVRWCGSPHEKLHAINRPSVLIGTSWNPAPAGSNASLPPIGEKCSPLGA